jgi:hypothetical protein
LQVALNSTSIIWCNPEKKYQNLGAMRKTWGFRLQD